MQVILNLNLKSWIRVKFKNIQACVGIMQDHKLFAKVVPDNQDFEENYSGLTF